LADRHRPIQIVRPFPDQDGPARASRSLAGSLESLGIIQIVVAPSAEILNLDRDIDLGNASLHAAPGPVGIHDPVRPDDIGRRQTILLPGPDFVLMRPRDLLGNGCPTPQNNGRKKQAGQS
jgi:hypothetical protein